VSTFRNERFTNLDVVVDGNSYERCLFVNCTLTYQGGPLPGFIRCKFQKTQVRLEGAALKTTQYLAKLQGAGLTVATEKVMGAILKGSLPLSQRPAPPPLLNTGQNYGRLGVYAGAWLLATVLLIAGLWYGMIVYPENVVLEATPARPLIKTALYDIMPALPDDLAASYDQINADQRAQRDSYGWVDEANGIAHIPVNEAMSLALEQGLFAQAE
jgi:hypothetical protein